jgi:hypothetical protein
MRPISLFPLIVLVAATLHAQVLPAQFKPVPDPTTPPARPFHDHRAALTFQVPVGWDLSRKDHEVSTLRLDARSTTRATQLRAVANITFNPYPASTFSGAYVYLSLTPKIASADCASQAIGPGPRKLIAKASNASAVPAETKQIAGSPFTHGYDEHGGVCTESRDEIYTASRNGTCLRFDLVINNFCGGEVSGVREITAAQLAAIRKRMEAILSTVQFDK